MKLWLKRAKSKLKRTSQTAYSTSHRLVLQGLKTITTIQDYCREINIPSPKHPFFDIRKFEDNMKTVNLKQAPFRHEFYAVALKMAGDNKEVNGRFLDSNMFFNSPYQIITWDINPDWEGWYIIFDKTFLSLSPVWNNFIIDFPYFRLDKISSVNLPQEDATLANKIFQQIFDEYHSGNKDKFLFIQACSQLLLLLTKRHFDKSGLNNGFHQDNRTADILLVSRFQSLVETLMTNGEVNSEIRYPSFYAEKLLVHPNHLNAVVKRITGKTATCIIQNQIITFAKSMLRQTELSAKEIAFRLHFKEPTHFNSFFKKATGCTPQQYRENAMI